MEVCIWVPVPYLRLAVKALVIDENLHSVPLVQRGPRHEVHAHVRILSQHRSQLGLLGARERVSVAKRLALRAHQQTMPQKSNWPINSTKNATKNCNGNAVCSSRDQRLRSKVRVYIRLLERRLLQDDIDRVRMMLPSNSTLPMSYPTLQQ